MSHDFIQSILDASLDLILVCDSRGTFIWVSKSASQILGYDPEEMIGKSAEEFLFPEDLRNTREMMRQSRREGEVRHFDCRYAHKNGHVVWLTWVGSYDSEEKKYHFIGRDITTHRITANLDDIREDLRNISERLISRTRALVFIRTADVYLIELFAIFSSLWAAWVLMTGDPNFGTFPTFALVRNIIPNEKTWAFLAMSAAVIKISGVAFGWKTRPTITTIVTRMIGMQMSAIFWVVMGLSTVLGNPEPLFGMIGLLLGLMSQCLVIKLSTEL